jgi:hypothetical protein
MVASDEFAHLLHLQTQTILALNASLVWRMGKWSGHVDATGDERRIMKAK